MSDEESTTPVGTLGYEQCRDELVDVVRRLEQGGMNLDAALTLWERGEALARRGQDPLGGARARIEAALSAPDGDDETT